MLGTGRRREGAAIEKRNRASEIPRFFAREFASDKETEADDHTRLIYLCQAPGVARSESFANAKPIAFANSFLRDHQEGTNGR